MGLLSNANALNHAVAARELQKAGQRQRQAQGVDSALLEQLLWEQRSTNRMLWALMSEEQRQAYQPPPPS